MLPFRMETNLTGPLTELLSGINFNGSVSYYGKLFSLPIAPSTIVMIFLWPRESSLSRSTLLGHYCLFHVYVCMHITVNLDD